MENILQSWSAGLLREARCCSAAEAVYDRCLHSSVGRPPLEAGAHRAGLHQGLCSFIIFLHSIIYLCYTYILFTNLAQDSVLGARGELLYTIEMDVVSTRYHIMLSTDTSSQTIIVFMDFKRADKETEL